MGATGRDDSIGTRIGVVDVDIAADSDGIDVRFTGHWPTDMERWSIGPGVGGSRWRGVDQRVLQQLGALW